MSAIIRTQDLCRSFQSGGETIRALKNVNIEIQEKSLTMLKAGQDQERLL